MRNVAFYILGLVFLFACGFALYTRAQEALWKAEVLHLNERLARWEAKSDFLKGRKRLLRLDGENSEMRFSGQHEGLFEIWIPEQYPSVSASTKYSDEQCVAMYNLFMRGLERESHKILQPRVLDEQPKKPSPTDRSTQQPAASRF